MSLTFKRIPSVNHPLCPIEEDLLLALDRDTKQIVRYVFSSAGIAAIMLFLNYVNDCFLIDFVVHSFTDMKMTVLAARYLLQMQLHFMNIRE